MPGKSRTILATILVLAFAIFAYLHAAPTTLDLAAMPAPADPDTSVLADLPANIRNLDGQVVAVEGYMMPMDQADHITHFAIVPKLFFSELIPPPSITQTIVANCSPTAYCADKIRFTGRLHVRSATEDGYVISLYDVDVQQIVPIYSGNRARWPWAVIGSFLAIAIFWLTRRALIRRRLIRTGCCIRCGYDLRATPTRCPECGWLSAVTIPA
jgi:hypothetical protein